MFGAQPKIFTFSLHMHTISCCACDWSEQHHSNPSKIPILINSNASDLLPHPQYYTRNLHSWIVYSVALGSVFVRPFYLRSIDVSKHFSLSFYYFSINVCTPSRECCCVVSRRKMHLQCCLCVQTACQLHFIISFSSCLLFIIVVAGGFSFFILAFISSACLFYRLNSGNLWQTLTLLYIIWTYGTHRTRHNLILCASLFHIVHTIFVFYRPDVPCGFFPSMNISSTTDGEFFDNNNNSENTTRTIERPSTIEEQRKKQHSKISMENRQFERFEAYARF